MRYGLRLSFQRYWASMSLQGQIDARLWTSVQKRYDDGDYSGAILDGFYFLSDLIRDKSGCESDGAALIGSAFGGDNPVVKINPFLTESEKSEQRGVEQLLRGLYLALRNPRSHEKRADSVDTADAVLTFMSLILGMIDRSQSPFDTEQIVRKVFDDHFVPTKQYADALASRIPKRKRFDVLTRVFQRRTEGNIEHVALFTRAVLETVSSEVKASYWDMVSASLEEATSDADFRTAISITSEEWGKLSEIARLRTENRLIASIEEGEFDSDSNACCNGQLGTWAMGISQHFLMREALKDALIDRISTGERAAIDYVFQYFKDELIDRDSPPDWSLIYALKARLDADDEVIYEALWYMHMGDWHPDWTKELSDALADFRMRNQGTVTDGIPF